MTKYQQALLAGVAALAIAAGSGIASAQTHGGGSMGGAAQGGAAAGGTGAGAAAGGSGAANESSGPSGQSGGMAQPQHEGAGHSGSGAAMKPEAQKQPGGAGEGGKGAMQRHAQGAGNGAGESERNAKGKESGKPSAAESKPGGGEHRAAQGEGATPTNGTREGASAHEGANVAPSGSVKFSARQRTTIKRTIIDAHGAPRADHVDFDVRVGTVVPRDSIHVVAVPETLVRIEPSWRGFLYFVYEDEIVVVNPGDMHIVAVVAV